jgi:probable blue pigment (indigoidine) exporter
VSGSITSRRPTVQRREKLTRGDVPGGRMVDRSSAKAGVSVGQPGIRGTPSPQGGKSDLLLIMLLAAFWGSAFPAIHAGIVAGAPPLVFAAVRYLLTAGVLVATAFATRTRIPFARDLLPTAVFGGLFIISGYGALLYLGEVTTTGGLAAILTGCFPIASALFAYWLLPKERIGRWGGVGLAIGFGGVGVLVLPQLAHPFSSGFEGPVLVLLAMVTFALGSVLLRRTSRIQPSYWTLAIQFAIGGVVVGLVALLVGEPPSLGAGLTVLSSLVFLVVFPGVIGYTIYYRIHHRSGPTRASLIGYTNPIVGVLVGFTVFGEAVTAVEVAGMVLILAGLYLLQRDYGRSIGDKGQDAQLMPSSPAPRNFRHDES